MTSKEWEALPLTFRQKLVLVRRLEGYRLVDIAKEMGVTDSRVRQIEDKALTVFKECMEKYDT